MSTEVTDQAISLKESQREPQKESGLVVRGIAFTPLPQPLLVNSSDQTRPIGEVMSLLAQSLGSQVNQLIMQTGIPATEFSRHFLCSTMIELPFTTGSVKWQDIAAQLKQYGDHQPDTFVNAYECASWGYSLRHSLMQEKLKQAEPKQSQSRCVIVSIMDANVYDFEFWRYNDHWEHSGFGITTVILEVTAPLTDEMTIGSAVTHNGVAEFATVVRRTMMKKSGAVVALPFFPVNVQRMFEKLLRGQPSLPDLHADHGHCFGADPWLSLLNYGLNNRGLNNKIKQAQRFMACSVALNGYYAIAELMMTPDTVLIMNKEWQQLPDTAKPLQSEAKRQSEVKSQHVANVQEYRGTLKRMPFAHKPSIAEAQMLPLTNDSDFAVFANFTSSPYPVLLNVREHYQILSDLVDKAQQCWPGIFIAIRISMPGGMRIPANLLADNILLLEDLAAEEQKLIASANPLLVIEDRFSRIEIDNNDNSIRLRLYYEEKCNEKFDESRNEKSDEKCNESSDDVLPTDALQPLIACLHQRGVTDCAVAESGVVE